MILRFISVLRMIETLLRHPHFVSMDYVIYITTRFQQTDCCLGDKVTFRRGAPEAGRAAMVHHLNPKIV